MSGAAHPRPGNAQRVRAVRGDQGILANGNLTGSGVHSVLELVKGKKPDAAIISKLDRLTRSTRDAIDLIELFGKKDVALISVAESLDTESPMGRFFVRMIASIAELEREMIGSRTSAGLQNLKAQGMPAGPAPYGWRSVGKKLPMIEEEAEQSSLLARIKSLRASGLSLPAISSTLTSEGRRTRRGTEWRYQYVAGVLKTAAALSGPRGKILRPPAGHDGLCGK